ncbi:hypothetical protein OBBRIDRAFT_567809 [Obba rivulosa]|uniref:Uncharacterized protein n=1 Tax=Obba rivulosa TaxID=1052685 RepID=A0A8E2B254_9APHY|nr:hypothetical protein OBBRIDRAFT_567809 [Obba rivulosa]
MSLSYSVCWRICSILILSILLAHSALFQVRLLWPPHSTIVTVGCVSWSSTRHSRMFVPHSVLYYAQNGANRVCATQVPLESIICWTGAAEASVFGYRSKQDGKRLHRRETYKGRLLVSKIPHTFVASQNFGQPPTTSTGVQPPNMPENEQTGVQMENLPAEIQMGQIPPPSQWVTGHHRMTPGQQGMLDRLGDEHGIYFPFLDPYSPRYGRFPSKADAAVLINMLKDGQIPSQQHINSLPEAPREEITAPYEWQTANDPPTEGMMQQLQRASERKGLAMPNTANLTKADVAMLLRMMEQM